MRQFQRLHAEMGEGGFSEHIPTATKPTPPGFMVSDFGTEERIPSHLNTPQLMHAYATLHGLTTAPPGEFMGGWPHEGEDYMDTSRQYLNESAARVAMITQNQKAMYDTSKTGPEDPNVYNPDYDPDYTPEEHERRLEAGEPIIPTWIRPYRGERPQIRAVGRRS